LIYGVSWASFSININEDGVVESPVAEQLKRISEQLKTAREQAGIELAQVASQTFIPLRLLKAMDEGKFERLPEPVFIQGFIRRYGDAVGLDGRQMAKDFIVDPPMLKKPAEEFLSYHPDDDAPAPRNARAKKSKLQVPAIPLPPEPPVVPAAVPVVELIPVVASMSGVESAPIVELTPAVEPKPVVEASPIGDADSIIEPGPKLAPALTFDPAAKQDWAPSAGSPSSGRSSDGNSWIYWLGGLLALGLLAIGTMLVMQPKSGTDRQKPVGTIATPTPAAALPTATPKLAAPIVLTIKVLEESWVEVLSDGKSEISEVLPKGTQKTWTAKERLSITSGNAKGVVYSYNQLPEKQMGKTADPETLVFPPQP
jgi:cytoskeleton protein RodZ